MDEQTLRPVPVSAVIDRPITPAALELQGVGRTFGDVVALDDVSLRVEPGTVHCVLGENGAGKSTLCNLVYGGMRPTSGTVVRNGRVHAPRSPAEALTSGVAMVHQHFSLLPTMTVAENLVLGSGFRPDLACLRRRVADLEQRYGAQVPLDASVASLSLGARQQVEIVKALLHDPDLVLFDEPTAVLTPEEIDRFLDTCRRLAADGRAVVLVTHKLTEVMKVGDATTVLRHGRVAGSGRPDDLGADELVGLVMGREVGDLDPVLAASLGLAAPDSGDHPGSHRAAPPAMTRPALEIDGLSVVDEDGRTRLDGVGLEVGAGEIVGIAGVEGNGQTELVVALSGAITPVTGRILLHGRDVTAAGPAARTAGGLAVIPEDRHHEAVVPEMSVADNLLLGRLREFRRRGLLRRRAMREEAARLMAAYDVRGPGPDAAMATLSGGNQQKAVLARELSLSPLRCVVAAQPTRGLDLGAVSDVVTRLREVAGAGEVGVLVVSSELPELFALCDRILVAHDGRLHGPVLTGEPDARGRVSRLMVGAAA